MERNRRQCVLIVIFPSPHPFLHLKILIIYTFILWCKHITLYPHTHSNWHCVIIPTYWMYCFIYHFLVMLNTVCISLLGLHTYPYLKNILYIHAVYPPYLHFADILCNFFLILFLVYYYTPCVMHVSACKRSLECMWSLLFLLNFSIRFYGIVYLFITEWMNEWMN